MDEPPSKSGWLERLSSLLLREPEDREQLVTLLHSAFERNLLDSDALSMIEGVMHVSEMQARDIMVPRAQMDVIDISETPEKFIPFVIETAHSRFPVMEGSQDNVIGILLAKDLLRHYAENSGPMDLKALLRPAVVIPESKRLNMLLRDFRSSRNHMAIVVDEYGGVSGLITIEDVLEEIVGEIDDEHDEEEEAPIKPLGKGRYQINALAEIEEFNEAFACVFSDEDYDTVGGLLLAEFGRVPERGEDVVLAERFKFRVTASDNRRIIMLEMNDLKAE